MERVPAAVNIILWTLISAGQLCAQAAAPKLSDGMRDGIYVGFHRVRYSARADYRFLMLFPDGWVIRTVPEQGLDNFNLPGFLSHPQLDRSLVGHYRVYGHRLDIIWSESPDDRESDELDESGSDIHGYDLYTPACSHCSNFSGTYRWGDSTLQFLPDGTFVDRGGCVDQVLTFDLNHPRSGTGTYHLGNYSVTLNYADGRHVTRSFLRGRKSEWIAISEIVLHPPDYQPMP